MKTRIIGLGLIGGSIARDLTDTKFSTELWGVDNNPDHREEALELKLVDRITSIEEALQEADLVILSVPVSALGDLLPKILDNIPAKTTIADMGSAKESLCKIVAKHPKRKQFVASHPMAGTENSGPNAALRGLFKNKTAVICDRELSGAQHLKRVEALYETLEMRLVYMSSAEHDLHAAYVSHLSHISSFVLANTVLAKEKNVKTIFDLAGGGFESTVRLAKSSPAMWAPIFEQNHANIAKALESYIEHLKEFHQSLLSNETESLHKLMENANRIRSVLENIGSRRRDKS